MFETLDVFRMSNAMAQQAGQRQALVAQNVANADTPGYIGRDLPDFASSYETSDRTGSPRATRAAHLHGSMDGAQNLSAVEVRGQAGPNGNEVSLETEMLKSVDAKREHDRALAIYRSALTVLRSTLRTN